MPTVVDGRRKATKLIDEKRSQPILELGHELETSHPLRHFYKLLKRVGDVEKSVRDDARGKMKLWLEKNFTTHMKNRKEMRRLWTAFMRDFWLVDGRNARFALIDELCALIVPSTSLLISMEEGVDEADKNKSIDLLTKYWGAMFVCIQRQWEKLDEWRQEKFLVLQKHLWLSVMKHLETYKWDSDLVKRTAFVFANTAPFSTNRHSVKFATVDNGAQLQILSYYHDAFDGALSRCEGDTADMKKKVFYARNQFNKVLKNYAKSNAAGTAFRTVYENWKQHRREE